MSDQPNDAVTNAADLMINYTDDEIKAEVWEHVRKIVREEIRYYMSNNSSEIAQRVIVDNVGTFNSQVLRAMKDFMNNPRNIY